ncbi:tyrosine-type recombinase/integrase [Thermodesulfobacterium thermophilum]|uniref:tyrosine-type recombinase/integrase n=1 Tax=Thermodesulfobacterium thermophilum TaxID=886 RepID=UPI0003B459C2|nr:site-specific integrase [Thermodesulfobacterium thermophilum]
MALYWRCKNCRSVNSEKAEACKKCGSFEASGYEVQIMIGRTLVRKSFRAGEYELAKTVELELRKKQELVRIAEKLKSVDEGLSKLLGDNSFQKGNFVKVKIFWNKYFLWMKSNKKESTVRERITRWKKYLKPFLGEKTLAEITPALVEKYKTEKLKQGYSPASINRDIALLRHMLSMAVKWGYLKEHPLKGKIEMLREVPIRQWTFLTREEYEAVFENLSETYRDLYQFLVLTGARLGEALNLRWKDIMWEAGVAYLRDSKANRPRVIVLSDCVIDMLDERKRKLNAKEDERVFKHSDSEFRRAFKRALKSAGLPESIRIHDLRHTFASWLAIKGVPIQQIKELLGHSQITTTLRYAHLNPETLRRVVNTLESFEEKITNDRKVVDFNKYLKKKTLKSA